MRLIDADTLIEAFRENMSVRGGASEELATHIIRILDAAADIDIVRCKECKHWTGETEHYEDREYKACWQLCGQYVNSEFWCKYGEREGE